MKKKQENLEIQEIHRNPGNPGNLRVKPGKGTKGRSTKFKNINIKTQ